MRPLAPPPPHARFLHRALVLCALLLALASVMLASLQAGAPRAAQAAVQVSDLAVVLYASVDADIGAEIAGQTVKKQGPSCCTKAPASSDADSSDRDCLLLDHCFVARPFDRRFNAVHARGPLFSLAPLRRPPRSLA